MKNGLAFNREKNGHSLKTTIGVKNMFLHVTKAEYIDGYTIRVQFNNGESGMIDLKNELNGEVFEPLKDLDTFKKFYVDPDLETIVWENGADLAPEFLYENMKKVA